MSNKAVNMIRDIQTGNGPAKFVLHVLAHDADDNHQCAPSIEELSTTTQYARRTIMNALARLERLDLITIERRGRRTSVYTINVDICAQHVHHKPSSGKGDNGER